MRKIFEDKSEKAGQDYHIRLYSKKLASGKCQVKFYLNTDHGTKYYGYLLAEGRDTVSKVVSRIHRCITDYKGNEQAFFENLKLLTPYRYSRDALVFEQN